MNLYYSKCSIFASYAMTCPMCKVEIPANTQHECSNPKPEEKPKKIRRTPRKK